MNNSREWNALRRHSHLRIKAHPHRLLNIAACGSPPPHPMKFATSNKGKKMWKTFCFHRRNRFWYAKHSGIRIEMSWYINVGKNFVFFTRPCQEFPFGVARIFSVFFVQIFWILFNFLCFRNCNMSNSLTFRCLNVTYNLQNMKYDQIHTLH